jgi:hypothetical protein
LGLGGCQFLFRQEAKFEQNGIGRVVGRRHGMDRPSNRSVVQAAARAQEIKKVERGAACRWSLLQIQLELL